MRRSSPVQQWLDSLPADAAAETENTSEEVKITEPKSDDSKPDESVTENTVIEPIKEKIEDDQNLEVPLKEAWKRKSLDSALLTSTPQRTNVKRLQRDHSIQSEGYSPKFKNPLLRDHSLQSDNSGSSGSSVLNVLGARKVDAESVLLALGFGPSEKQQKLQRIPDRFLAPSKLKGISTEDFIKKEQHSMRMHDCGIFGYRGLTGVLWIDNNAITGAADTMNHFRKLGKKIFYVTNNSTKIRSEFAAKATQLGFIASQEEILSTAYLVAHYLKGIGFTKKVYLLGSNGIGEELKAVGIRHIGVGPDHVTPEFKSMQPSELDPEVGAVVVGFDEHVSYPKFMKAASYLASEECLFIATNTDERFPKGGSIVVPGTGTLVRAVETCSERKALVLGKPHSYVRKYLESCGLNPARTLMIGDRCNTDIELGVRCGFQTLLVMSGVTTTKELEKLRTDKTPPLPDVVLPKLGDLLPLIP